MTAGRRDIFAQAILKNHHGNALHSQQGTTNERPSASAIDWIGAARQDPKVTIRDPNNFNATSI